MSVCSLRRSNSIFSAFVIFALNAVVFPESFCPSSMRIFACMRRFLLSDVLVESAPRILDTRE
jgi:hypothetical protein